jgi:hypothetical protein
MSFGSFLFGQGQFAQGEQSANTGAALVPSQSLSLSQRQVTTTGVNNVNEGGSSGGRIDHRKLRFVGTEFSSRDRQPAPRPVVSVGAVAEFTGFRLNIIQRQIAVSASGTGTVNSSRVRLTGTAPQGLGYKWVRSLVLNTEAAEAEFNFRTQHLRGNGEKLSEEDIALGLFAIRADEVDRLRAAGKTIEAQRREEDLVLQLLEL